METWLRQDRDVRMQGESVPIECSTSLHTEKFKLTLSQIQQAAVRLTALGMGTWLNQTIYA